MGNVKVNIKGKVLEVPQEDLVTGGTFACSGCGAILGTKLALKALGPNTIMVNSAGCMTLTVTWPFTPYKVPWVHSAIENAGATATGILMALKAQKLDKKVNVLCYAGDGASYDIGLQALSGMVARRERIIYVCYNNASFANTGFQHSSATPYGARTKTSEPGKECPLGNVLPRKNLAKMMAMNGAEYVATASVAYPIDFINKLRKAKELKGPVFIDLLTHCVPGWLHDDANGIQVGQAMVESGMWPLYEIHNKKVTITHKPKMIPVTKAIKMQGRFKHLCNKNIKEIQGIVKNTKLSSIKEACKITDQIYSKLIKNFNKFNSEKDVAKFVLKETKKRGLRPAFKPIIATGKNAAEIHHKHTNDWYKGFCVIDIGVRVNGYCSDMSRTVYIGKPNKREKQLYKLVLNAQQKSIKKVKPNAICKKIAEYNRKLLGKHKHQMPHGLGHGVGKHIHMKPKISIKSKDILKKGDAITIEPGIYHKGKFGIRIEDTMVVGGSTLTKSSRRLIIL
jgi:pyruvate ferredoxin oxidoreductase beta subunit